MSSSAHAAAEGTRQHAPSTPESWSWEPYIAPAEQPSEEASVPGEASRAASGAAAISMDSVEACWTALQEDSRPAMALQGLSMAILQGRLIVVTGEVAAGS